MSNLRETQHKRVVMLAASTIVFCLFSLWQLSSRIFEVGYSAGFEFTNREIYLFSSCTLIFMTVIVLLVRSFQDNAAIRYFEYHDKQTGLPNRANVIQTLNRHMREGDSNGLFVMIDLGRLKSINNSMGSEVGDQVLAAYGNRLSYFFESPNMVFKLHAGTFGIFLPEVGTERIARELGMELQKAVAIPVEVDGRALFLSLDLGGCFLRDCDNGAGQVLQRAELALIDAKKRDSKELNVFSREMAAKIRQQSMLETDLHEVLEREGLEPYFQPLVAEDGKTMIGVEALARWFHPNQGYIPPVSFVPVAEELNLTEKLGRQIMLKACKCIKPLGNLKLSVNVSPKDLLRPGFVAEIQYVLFETGMPPERLEIEITESIFISATDEIADTIRRIQSLGVSVALDDFGTGYSGLSYLDKFRVDRIKVDSSFVAEIETSQGARSMISTIISMACERGYDVTVEGIENEVQFEFLRKFPGLVYQGYYFGRPQQFSDLLDNPMLTESDIAAFRKDSEEEQEKLRKVA